MTSFGRIRFRPILIQQGALLQHRKIGNKQRFRHMEEIRYSYAKM